MENVPLGGRGPRTVAGRGPSGRGAAHEGGSSRGGQEEWRVGGVATFVLKVMLTNYIISVPYRTRYATRGRTFSTKRSLSCGLCFG